MFYIETVISCTMNSMMNMVLKLNISVLHRDFDKLYNEHYDEHGVKIEHQCFT